MALLLAHLAFLPWALGAVHPWSQVLSLALAAAAFIVALRGPRVALLRFPAFWLGALLLAYIAIQGCNPSWRFIRSDTS